MRTCERKDKIIYKGKALGCYHHNYIGRFHFFPCDRKGEIKLQEALISDPVILRLRYSTSVSLRGAGVVFDEETEGLGYFS